MTKSTETKTLIEIESGISFRAINDRLLIIRTASGHVMAEIKHSDIPDCIKIFEHFYKNNTLDSLDCSK